MKMNTREGFECDFMKFRGTGVKQEISMLQNDVEQVLIRLESVQFRAVYRIAKLE